MKNLWLIGAVVFALASCGGPSVCGCVESAKKRSQELDEAGGDKAKRQEIKDKYKEEKQACEDMYEKASKDEQEKMEEEAKEC